MRVFSQLISASKKTKTTTTTTITKGGAPLVGLAKSIHYYIPLLRLFTINDLKDISDQETIFCTTGTRRQRTVSHRV